MALEQEGRPQPEQSEKPTFHGLRLKHGISLEAIYEFAERSIRMEIIQLFDETGRANPSFADDLLSILSELSGQQYKRADVGGIVFVLARPPASPTHPQPQRPLPAQPTLLELARAYTLDLNWLGEATVLQDDEVADLLYGRSYNQAAIQQLLQVISDYTGVLYTLDTIKG